MGGYLLGENGGGRLGPVPDEAQSPSAGLGVIARDGTMTLCRSVRGRRQGAHGDYSRARAGM